MDEKKLPFNTAVELSFLKPEEQGKVVDFIKKEQIIHCASGYNNTVITGLEGFTAIARPQYDTAKATRS